MQLRSQFNGRNSDVFDGRNSDYYEESVKEMGPPSMNERYMMSIKVRIDQHQKMEPPSMEWKIHVVLIKVGKALKPT